MASVFQHRLGETLYSLMPSGIHPGKLSLTMREALTAHTGVPSRPVIEEGTYDDFKDCVFRVCSIMACEVALKDLEQECAQRGALLHSQHRRWNYVQYHKCVTSIEIRMEIARGSAMYHELEEFLSYLARKYDFVYNKVIVSYQRQQVDIGNNGGYYHHEGTIAVDMEIVWPDWR